MVGSGSGISKQNLLIAFIQKEVGSGIRDPVLFYLRDGAMVGSGSGIKHPGSATLIIRDILSTLLPLAISTAVLRSPPYQNIPKFNIK
jgi:hypothetical protein